MLFDNGAGASPLGVKTAGDPYPGFEKSFSAFPIPGTTAKTWYFGPSGTLSEAKPLRRRTGHLHLRLERCAADRLRSEHRLGRALGRCRAMGLELAAAPGRRRRLLRVGAAEKDTTAIGGGAVTLWLKSSTPDVDLLATVSEVRPDGNETFVQNGYLRASERKLATSKKNILAEKPSVLQPIPTMLASDKQPMPSGEYVPVTIPLYFEGHAYRAGSRIRVTISAPNGTQPIWSFAHTEPEGTTAQESVAFSPSMPSSLTLPVVPGVSIPTELPPCPSLRNEPCRSYQPSANDGS